MLKKSIASLVLSMVMLASGSVFAFSDTGVKNHADGKDCPGFYQSDSFSTYSGGWTQTNSTDKSGNHWTKRTVRNGNQYFCAYVSVVNGGKFVGPQSLTSSYVKSKVTVRSKKAHTHKIRVES